MKKIFLHGAALLFLLLLAVQSTSAAGLGVNRTYSNEAAPALQPTYPTMLDMIMERIEGIDIVYDTAVAKDQLFNFRMNIQCRTIQERLSILNPNNTRNTNNIILSNTFGFGFVRTPFIRLWAGPQFALSCQFVNKNNRFYDSVIYNKFGVVAGANIHASENITIAIEIGLRTGFGFDLTRSLASSITSAKLEPIAGLKLIFRAWDSYSSGI